MESAPHGGGFGRFGTNRTGGGAPFTKTIIPIGVSTRTGTSLLLAEMCLRAGGFTPTYVNPLGSFHEFDPVIGHRGKANVVGNFKRPEFNVRVVHDANGFRNRAGADEKPAKSIVYVLGDSFTWGWGAERPYTEYAEPLLPRRRVCNLGLSATGTVQQFVIFQRFVEPQVTPHDVVVLAVYCNDLKDNLGQLNSSELHAVAENGVVREVAPSSTDDDRHFWSLLREHSYLVNLGAFVCNRHQLLKQQSRAMAEASALEQRPAPLECSDFAPFGDELLVMRTYLRKFRDACVAKNVAFLVVYIPGRTEFGESGVEGEDVPIQQLAACRRGVHGICNELHIPRYNMADAFLAAKSESPETRLTFEHDFHWNDAGHRVAGRALADFVRLCTGGDPK
jgi:lysophospholipase L1-like esterase